MNHQLHPTETHRTQLEAPDVQNVEGDLVALADLAEQILNWGFGI
jgi:hypothetical protein